MNILSQKTLLALALAGLLTAPASQAIDLGGLVDRKALDQVARDKLGVRTDAGNAADAGIPLVGNPGNADEEKLGREVAGRLLGAAALVQDDALQKYVNKVGRYVAAQSDRPDLNWTFGVIESPSVNAFAAPGGYVFVTRGLYALLQNEAELAGVLAHEIGHVNARHHVRLMQKQRVVSMGQEFLTQKAGKEDVKKLVGNGAEILARSLDKASEFEADRLGVYYATRAGYDSYGLPAVLDRLQASGGSDRFTLLYKTHPLPSARLSALDVALDGRYDAVPTGLVLDKRLAKLPPAPVAKAPAPASPAKPAAVAPAPTSGK
ncbi:MAG: peptidase Ste24p [Moraxellaceae bacterium]|jgi:predicted Zn-dependent protease|nr:peptidase Ste24p [Moraxellaceae bacterium]